MGLDIRWPIGLMFTLIGVLLTGYGIFKSAISTIQISGQSVNIDFYWGIVLLVFGVAMLLGAIKGGKNPPDA
ncbi:MAG: hypothetical protein ABSF34_18565 [Verrucomicrobiota bacterium]|jgi:uncharacterized membrane protein YidH (DUF202 family)